MTCPLNMTPQCLVCLEEYSEEEEIRIMRCRHAFHKACVDEWMQKGRNNCPACRSMVHLFIYLSLPYSDPLLYNQGVPMDAHDAHDPPVLAT